MNYSNIISYFKFKKKKLRSRRIKEKVERIRVLVTFTDMTTCEMTFTGDLITHNLTRFKDEHYPTKVRVHRALSKFQSFLSNYSLNKGMQVHPGFLTDVTNTYHNLSEKSILNAQIIKTDKLEKSAKVYEIIKK